MIKKIIRRTILICTIILMIVYALMHCDKSVYTKENVEEYVSKMCEINGVPGLSAAIIDGKDEYYINHGQSIDENSRFELGSTTKAFTALGILKLEKEGRLSISDSVSIYLPWFKPTFKEKAYDITIEELLCHMSGIPVWTISTIPEGEDTDEGLLTKTIQNIKNVKLDSLPGTHHEYATINYDILALIIEEVTGQKYEDYISAEILDSMDMHGSFFRTKDSHTDMTVQGYKTGFLFSLPYNAPTYYGNTAAGYLVSDTSDLMKWMKNWTINSQDTSGLVNYVLEHDVSKTGNYFSGWNIYEEYICHGGNNPNFSSQVIISRQKNQGVFVLSDLAGSSATNIADGIYRMLLGEKITIGFQNDVNKLTDCLSIVAILLLIYFTLLLWDKRSRMTNIVRIIGGVVFIAAVFILPVIFHYPYNVMYVWLPITVFMLLGVSVVLAVFNIFTGCLRCIRNAKGIL